MIITIIYYVKGQYVQLEGKVSKINLDTKIIQIVKTKISLRTIVDIRGDQIPEENYLCTESVVKNNIKYNNKFKALFRNMLKPIFNIENDQIENTSKSIAFMNYFLRPSEYTGASIKHEYIDSLFSYLNLIRVWEALEKPNIIICSAKARDSFKPCFENYKGLLKNPVDETDFKTEA